VVKKVNFYACVYVQNSSLMFMVVLNVNKMIICY